MVCRILCTSIPPLHLILAVFLVFTCNRMAELDTGKSWKGLTVGATHHHLPHAVSSSRLLCPWVVNAKGWIALLVQCLLSPRVLVNMQGN